MVATTLEWVAFRAARKGVAVNAGSILATDARLKIAEAIVQLSNQVLSIHDNRRHGYFALKIGTGPNSNVATVRTNRVSFFIRTMNLIDNARSAGFDPQAVEPKRPRDKNKYRFLGLNLSDLQGHEGLFTEIVKDSVETIIDRKPRRKSR